MYKTCLFTILGFTVGIAPLVAEENSSHLSEYRNLDSKKQTQQQIQDQADQAKDEAQKSLVPEAVSIIEETKRAMSFIKNRQHGEALSSLERAAGKSHILLARYPEDALLPVEFSIRVTDLAPADLNKIKETEKVIKKFINNKNYPAGRILLNLLSSEIQVTTYSLPLAYYPQALKEAARLLELHQTSEAYAYLETALNTLMVTNKIFPIPLIKAVAYLNAAKGALEQQQERNKKTSLALLHEAKDEIKRGLELGYLEKNEHIDAEFVKLEANIKKDQITVFHFNSLIAELEHLLNHVSKPKNISNY